MNKKRLKIIAAWLTLSALILAFTGCGKDISPSSAVETLLSAVTAQTEMATETEAVTETVTETEAETVSETETATGVHVTMDGTYTNKEEVAAYINEFKCLPSNYITKSEAKSLGWDSSKGNLWDVAEGKSIGGDRFGNYEGHLPKKKGRTYYECDIGYEGGYRGAERIIYSDDGLIYYTEDHYNTFELLYGES